MSPDRPQAEGLDRLLWIDLLRVASAYAIVVFHAISDTTRANYGLGLLRWPVPLFVAISGALLLHGSRTESAGEFYRRRVRRLLAPLVVWSIFYLVYRKMVFGSGDPVDFKRMAFHILTGRPTVHLWFLYMLLGLYLVTPFLRTYVRAASERETQLLALAVLTVTYIHESWASFAPSQPGIALTLFVPYVGLFLYGHVLRSLPERRFPSWTLGITVIASLVALSAGTTLLPRWTRLPGALVSAHSAPLTVALIGAGFLLARQTVGSGARLPAWLREAVGSMAGVSLGIYIIHPVFQRILETQFLALRGNPAWEVLLATGTFAISYGVCVALARLPYARRLV